MYPTQIIFLSCVINVYNYFLFLQGRRSVDMYNVTFPFTFYFSQQKAHLCGYLTYVIINRQTQTHISVHLFTF